MTRYFMRDTPLCQMEQQMMTLPYFRNSWRVTSKNIFTRLLGHISPALIVLLLSERVIIFLILASIYPTPVHGKNRAACHA